MIQVHREPRVLARGTGFIEGYTIMVDLLEPNCQPHILLSHSSL